MPAASRSEGRSVQSAVPVNDTSRATSAACRAVWPDVAFAASFLPKGQRHAVNSVGVVLHQVVQIIDPAAGDDHACEQEGDKPGCPTPTACGETCQGGGETPQQRRDVCSSILDYLFSGQSTGRPELDGFASVAKQFDLPQASFESFAAGLNDLINTPRYAIWRRLRESLEETCGTAARLVWRILAASQKRAARSHRRRPRRPLKSTP